MWYAAWTACSRRPPRRQGMAVPVEENVDVMISDTVNNYVLPSQLANPEPGSRLSHQGYDEPQASFVDKDHNWQRQASTASEINYLDGTSPAMSRTNSEYNPPAHSSHESKAGTGIKRIAETLQNHDLPVVKPLAPAYRRKLTDGDAKAITQPARKFAPEPEKSEFGFPTELRHDFARAARRPHTSAAESRSSCRT